MFFGEASIVKTQEGGNSLKTYFLRVSVIKWKNGVITIQAASKTRRLHRHCGSGPATSGRKVKDRPSHSRAISEDIDDEDITFAHVRHSLPSQKEKKENKNSL